MERWRRHSIIILSSDMYRPRPLQCDMYTSTRTTNKQWSLLQPSSWRSAHSRSPSWRTNMRIEKSMSSDWDRLGFSEVRGPHHLTLTASRATHHWVYIVCASPWWKTRWARCHQVGEEDLQSDQTEESPDETTNLHKVQASSYVPPQSVVLIMMIWGLQQMISWCKI